MSGLYSPINRLMEQVTRPKGTGAEYMTELAKKPGYKPAEAEDRDLQMLMALPQMQRAEFMEKLKAQANKFPLKMRELGEGQTHHETYTLPGGENYREILLHTPDTKREELKKKLGDIGDLMASPGLPSDQYLKLHKTRAALADQYTHGTEGSFGGNPAHFGGTPNILASVRVKDRTSPEGKKILHIEEIQSDWHQQGREHGYHPKDLYAQIRAAKAEKKMMDRYLREADEDSGDMAYGEYGRMVDDHQAAIQKLDRLEQLKEEGVPHGPHAKDWHELALKAMIQHAAENGYDQIAVTPGAEQAKRFGLSKQVGSVSYHPETQHFQAFKPNRETITSEKDATPERVKALIGKDAAEKLMQAPKQMGHHYLEGNDLDMGGEGMKGFYDKMVPAFLNKFGKKHGVQVQSGSVPIVSTPAQHHGMTEDQFQAQSPDEQQHMVRQHAYAYQGAKTEAPVHTFDITPQMREDVVKNGIPRYAEGGDVNDSDRMTPRSRGRASFGAAPRGNQITKETGGNWVGGNVEKGLKPLKVKPLPDLTGSGPVPLSPNEAALNNWVDRNLTNYVKKQMATKDDPVRGLFEQGITHIDPAGFNYERERAFRKRLEADQPQLGQTEAGKSWENAADSALSVFDIGKLHPRFQEPWMEKAPKDTKVVNADDLSGLGFDHIIDILKQDLAEGRIRPEQLNKISMEQAVRRVHEYNEEQAKKMRETTVKATEGMPVHKEYDTGHKWIELAKPEAKQAMTPDEADEKYAAMYAAGKPSSEAEAWMQKYRKDRDAAEKEPYQKLDQALKYEGNTMGHCVGGYTADVANGNSRIFSLRDAKGEPHVTIETAPMESSDLGRHMADKKRAGASAEEIAKGFANPPQRIVQIKGKQNRAPNKEYLPMVQDFVRSGNWSDVGDAQNAGLRRYGNVFNEAEDKKIKAAGKAVPEHGFLTGAEIQELHNTITPEGKRLKYDPYGNVTGHEGNYAKGGSIKPVGHAVVKEKVTISPNMDVMRYELMGVKHLTKKVK